MFSMLPPCRRYHVDERWKENLLLLHTYKYVHNTRSLLMERAYHSAKVAPARRLLRARPGYEPFDVKLFECNYIF